MRITVGHCMIARELDPITRNHEARASHGS